MNNIEPKRLHLATLFPPPLATLIGSWLSETDSRWFTAPPLISISPLSFCGHNMKSPNLSRMQPQASGGQLQLLLGSDYVNSSFICQLLLFLPAKHFARIVWEESDSFNNAIHLPFLLILTNHNTRLYPTFPILQFETGLNVAVFLQSAPLLLYRERGRPQTRGTACGCHYVCPTLKKLSS